MTPFIGNVSSTKQCRFMAPK